jgi:hypothetical protein
MVLSVATGLLYRTLINIFITISLGSVVISICPGHLGMRSAYRYVTPYLIATGLRQDWRLFAPNPSRTNARVYFQITDRNSRQTRILYIDERGYGDLGHSASNVRYRKFFHDRLPLFRNRRIWKDVAQYVLSHNNASTLVFEELIEPIPEPYHTGQVRESWRRTIFTAAFGNVGRCEADVAICLVE